MPRTALKVGLLVLLMLAPLELSSWIAGRVLAPRGVVYLPPEAEGFDAYLARRDPLLGWPPPAARGGPIHDEHGARRAPDEAPGPPCMAVFGDSFTFGDEVAPDETYAHALGERLRCRVANYGVGGYGTDQAYLRYRERFEEPADVVLLAHYSENIIRNVNRYRGFLTGGGFGWKPRFRLDDGSSLELLPMPTPAAASLASYGLEAPLPEDDFFVPGGPAGMVALRFPYSVSMLRLFGMYRVRARLAGVPSYAPFYDPAHPSGALELTAEILRGFMADARERLQIPVVMVIPDEHDLLALLAGEDLPYQPLLDALASRGILTPRLAQRLLAELDGEPPCALYLSCGGAHMNPRGHRAIATVLAPWLAEHGALPVGRAAAP